MCKRNVGALFSLAILLMICPSFFVSASRQDVAPDSTTAIQLQPFLSGLSNPVFLTHAHDGTNRVFIVEQGGIIKVLQPGSTTPTVFLDITPKVLLLGEQGLLGLAFHPDYSVNRRFFVNYIRSTDDATVIAEYQASPTNPNVALTTETLLLAIPQPFDNHKGGWMDFGPDGYLYIATGDGGSGNDPGNRAQNIDELLGKMLRIDVDHPNGPVPYSSPVTNPFFGSTPGRDEIYAYGLRNPWRNSFDRVTGELYIGDVGQSAREEIDIGAPGANYGWRVMEGSICNPAFNGGVCTPPPGSTLPIADYSHTGGRCSVTGGYVYRGARGSVPVGAYIFGDYCTGEIFQLQSGAQTLLLDSPLLIASFGEDEAGEIYVAHRSGTNGTISRIDSTTPPPPCTFSVFPVGTFFANSGGEGSFTVASSSTCNWIVASTVDWIRVTSNSKGNAGDIITFEVRKNFGGALRTGTIQVGGQIFTVTQGATGCFFKLATKKQTFGAGAGMGGVGVTAPGGCGWTAVSNADWIIITSGNSSTGNATVTYTVAANTTGSKRVGTMTIAGQAFTVKQKG